MHPSIPEAQPRALKFLFLTEHWERFAYFAVQSILVLFMTKSLKLTDSQAYVIFSAFGSLLFVMPLFGGYVADKFLGYISAVIFGIILLGTGYFLLASANIKSLPLALAILIVGNGFFKPNISNLLGSMYAENAKNRDVGFMIFYLGINIGATIGVISCGFIAKYHDWSLAIATAAIGLIIGGIIFIAGYKCILRDICRVATNRIHKPKITLLIIFLLAILILIAAAYLLITHIAFVNLIMILITITLFVYIGTLWSGFTKDEKNKLLVCTILIIFSIAFWALYQQSFMSVVMFLEKLVNLRCFGKTIPASVVNSLNGIFLITLTPIIIKFWDFLRHKNKEPSVITKFALGILFMGLGYLVISIDAHSITTYKLAAFSPIVFSYAIQTLGELFLSPVGLAMITVLSPKKIRGLMMGVWFFSLALATNLAGQLAKLTGTSTHLNKVSLAAIYSHSFLIYASLAIVISLILFSISKKLNKLIIQ